MMNNETILKALRILANFGKPCTPREFARYMWPDSLGWRKPSKRPRPGEEYGAVMSTAGAGFLGRLGNLVFEDHRGWFSITPSGVEYLSRQGGPIPWQLQYQPRWVTETIWFSGQYFLVKVGDAWVRWDAGMDLYALGIIA